MPQSDWHPQQEVRARQNVDERTLAARDRAMLREGLMATARTMAVNVVLGSAVLLVAIYLLRSSFAAGEQLLKGKSEDWYEAQMPAVLLALLGAAIGVFAGWRLSSSGGMTGMPAWLVAAAGVALICLIGAVGAAAFFPSAIPFTVWIGLGAMLVTTMLALTFYTVWAA